MESTISDLALDLGVFALDIETEGTGRQFRQSRKRRTLGPNLELATHSFPAARFAEITSKMQPVRTSARLKT
jgi:hypothetical protein